MVRARRSTSRNQKLAAILSSFLCLMAHSGCAFTCTAAPCRARAMATLVPGAGHCCLVGGAGEIAQHQAAANESDKVYSRHQGLSLIKSGSEGGENLPSPDKPVEGDRTSTKDTERKTGMFTKGKLCEIKDKITKNQKSSKARKKKSVEPMHWRDEFDEFILDDGIIDRVGDNITNMEPASVNRRRKEIKFTVRGKPRPLRRHRTSKGFMYNPSSGAQKSFRSVVSNMLPKEFSPARESTDADSGALFFEEGDFIAISIMFRLPRPKDHFIGRKPGPGRLRQNSPGRLHHTRVDVDNLAKFVLDSLNGVLYRDDRQVVWLQASKVLDTEGDCDGATEVKMTNLRESDCFSGVMDNLNLG